MNEADVSSHTSLHNRVAFDSSIYRSIGQFCSRHYTSRAQKNWPLPPALLHVHPDLRQILKSLSCSMCQIAETQHSCGRWTHYEGQAATLGYREQHTQLRWQPSSIMWLSNMPSPSPFCERCLYNTGKGNTWELGTEGNKHCDQNRCFSLETVAPMVEQSPVSSDKGLI